MPELKRKPFRLVYILIILCLHHWPFMNGLAQESIIKGRVLDSLDAPIELASISVKPGNRGTSSNADGFFELRVPAEISIDLEIDHVSYLKTDLSLLLQEDEIRELTIVLSLDVRMLEKVEVSSGLEDMNREMVSIYMLDPKNLEVLPAPFGDFNQILVTLPGVVSNNELSSTYSVRGGNFDENLVYVNNIPVYRPFLIRAGEQEGLSFVNPDLTQSVAFSTGGWEAKYGDKLSSNLNVTYKRPDKYAASAMISLLGGSLHAEGVSANDRFSFLLGARHKRSEYLLNTLETEGEYLPRFTDFQGYFSYKLNDQLIGQKPKTEVGLLMAVSQNRYKVVPESRETTFGTFNQPLNLFVAFEGQDISNYNTFQAGLKIDHQFSDRYGLEFILSSYYTLEREYFDVEAGYRLCDVDKRPGSETFNKCITLRGIGTEYRSARNQLDGNIVNAEIRNKLKISDNSMLEYGIGYMYQQFEDRLHEYSFLDSADYTTVTELIKADNLSRGNQVFAYIQNGVSIKSIHKLTYGLRFNYFDINKDLLISPRIQYAVEPNWLSDILFRASAGLYAQHPLYRELRRFNGELNNSVKAQRSLHLIAGMDYNFTMWNRSFKFISEIYYKHMNDVNPYNIDNVRIRYFADNIAKAYATGIDLRVSGEFVPGDESWFSLGFLRTREDLEIDQVGYIPRPTDQLVNFNIFFQDHIPNNPSFRVYLNLNFASGLPFSPPGNLDLRNAFRSDSYQRADIGFSKIFQVRQDNRSGLIDNIWLGVEVLNLTGRENNISYYWVRDFNDIYYGVPNSLSTRFFNVKMMVKI